MKTGNINHISINDYFWIRFIPQMINFGFQGLPKDVHYSISFSDKSPDINFHITKETEDRTNKPKITIVCMDKKLLQEWLEEILPILPSSLLNKILEPLDILALKNKRNDNLGFISLESLKQKDIYSLSEQKQIDSFKEMSKVKKRLGSKLKVILKHDLKILWHLMN